MAPKFGTSGLRGLVVDLQAELVSQYVTAFVATCAKGTALYVGRDLRASSPDIAGMVIAAARDAGADVVDCGAVPTPALALVSIKAGASAIMVTGSHIPADRNGLKFYTPEGEISKADEATILGALGVDLTGSGSLKQEDINGNYVARYVDAFGPTALDGLKIGAYTHSTVGRDLLIEILRQLGAVVTELERSDTFIPVDTEAVSDDARRKLQRWASSFDAVVSMDGDGDRPMLTDENGKLVAGDILGQITAHALGAKVVVTPISSNTAVHSLGFDQVINTRIGSPFVIAGMVGLENCVGYEANGGFLLGYEARGLSPLLTRDSMLPIVATLAEAREQGVSALVAKQPKRFTASDRLVDFPTDASAKIIQNIQKDPTILLEPIGLTHARTDLTDGVRMICEDAIIHVRPSGNAPELRLYVEGDSEGRCIELLRRGLQQLEALK